MTRETADAKARRLLAEGRVLVTYVSGDVARARVDGDTGTWEASHDAGGWHCTCPARGRCSHAAALRMITTAPAYRATQPERNKP